MSKLKSGFAVSHFSMKSDYMGGGMLFGRVIVLSVHDTVL